MSAPDRSEARRDLEQIDAALMDLGVRLIDGGLPDPATGEGVLCRLAAERMLAVAETVAGLVSRSLPRVPSEGGLDSRSPEPW